MRTSEVFGVQRLFLSPSCPLPTHPRASRTGRGAEKVVPYEICALQNISTENRVLTPFFALETGGTPIDEFDFPESGTILVGSEELGLSPQALKLANEHLGRVAECVCCVWYSDAEMV